MQIHDAGKKHGCVCLAGAYFKMRAKPTTEHHRMIWHILRFSVIYDFSISPNYQQTLADYILFSVGLTKQSRDAFKHVDQSPFAVNVILTFEWPS